MASMGLKLLLICIFILYIVTTVYGCYANLQLTSASRRQISIATLNDKIYFAGGRSLPPVSALFDIVEVLDTRTNSWSAFRLSVPRIITVGHAVVDPYILYIGGQTLNAPASIIDIWNSETETLQTIPLAFSSQVGSHVETTVVGRNVFMLAGNFGVYSLNVDTLAWTNYNVTTITKITSNETHLFAYMRQPSHTIYSFEISTETWTVLVTVPADVARLDYSNNMLFAINSRLISYIDLETLALRIYAYPTTETLIAAVTIDGSDIYMANRGVMTIHNPVKQTSFQYEFDGPVEQPGGLIATHNRVMYIPGGFTSNGGVQTFDLRTLFEQMPNLPRDRAPAVFERGIMFWADFGDPRIYTYKVDTAEYAWHEHPEFASSITERRFIIGNKMVLRSRTNSASVSTLVIYNFEDHSFTVVYTPEGFSYGHTTVIGDVMVINGGFTDLWLFNVTSGTFSPRKTLPYVPRIFDSSHGLLVSATASLNLLLLDVHTMQYHVEDLNLRPTTILTFDEVIVAMLDDFQNPTLIVYNVASRVTQRWSSSLAITLYTNPRPRKVDQFAIYFGPRADGTRTRVEMYDTLRHRWHMFDLPSSSRTSSNLAFTNMGSLFYFSAGAFIDVYDVETETFSVFPFQFANTFSFYIGVTGSKLIIQTFGATGTVTETRFFVYETTTRRYSTVSFHGITNQVFYSLWKNKIIYLFQEIRAMEIPVLFDTFDNRELFIGQSTNLSITAAGQGLRYVWTRGGDLLDASTPTLELDNVTLSQQGTYRVIVSDLCNRPMQHSAALKVHDVPRFTIALRDSIALCHEETSLNTSVDGVAVSYRWSINNVDQPNAVNPALTLSQEQLPCNSQNSVCVTASNPSGETSICAQVRLVELDSLIAGPAPIESKSKWFAEDIVYLQVKILDEECPQHAWYQDGELLASFTSFSSQHRMQLTSAKARSQFVVKVQCGSNVIPSRAFSFGEISALPVWGLVLIIVAIVAAVVVFLVIVYGLRKRLVKSQGKEVELTSLLSKAKTESLKKDRTPILNATVWEWTPTDDFTYQSLADLPVSVNTSDLKFSEKGAPVDVDMYYNRVIKFENTTKSSSKRGLKEKLINGTSIDIYAPKSPKYQIVVDPAGFVIDDNETIEVTISLKMHMTAKCNITLVLVLEQHKIYSAIEFNATSNMSTWIDLEEIEMSGEFLGGGGFGSVVRGVYRSQDVAVKKLLSQYLTDDMKIEFEREVTLMKSLRHPNIVQFVGASNVKESLALVIEYAPLGSLASVMEKQTLSVQFKVQCLLETAKALQFLHSNGIIHRDIKPQNILVFSLETRAAVHVKLTDFGTSRFIADDPTTITKNVGTISYMAPEALGRNPRIDKSADVYSFALLMWSVLFEQVPFKEFQWDSDIEQHVKSGNRLPFPHGHEIDPLLVKLIEECWQHDPSLRPTMPIVVQRLSNIK